MVDVLSDPALFVVTGGEPPTLAQLEARYARQVGGRSDDGLETWHNWVVRDRATGAAIGFLQATLTSTDDGGRAELAWVVGRPWQGAGAASEAAAALGPVLRQLGGAAAEDEVVAHIAPGHVASEQVARHLGLRPTTRLDDGEVVWSSRV